MEPKYAYAHGALVKMAEHSIDPATFVRAAVQTRNPLALKIANAIVDYERAITAQQKQAGMASRALGGAGIGGLMGYGGAAAAGSENPGRAGLAGALGGGALGALTAGKGMKALPGMDEMRMLGQAPIDIPAGAASLL